MQSPSPPERPSEGKDEDAEAVLRLAREWQEHLREQRARIQAELDRAADARRVARWALEQARRRTQ